MYKRQGVTYVLFGTLDNIEKETKRYKSGLDVLAAQGQEYLDAKNRAKTQTSHKKVDDEILEKNDIKLTSFVADYAKTSNIEVSSYDENELPFGNSKGAEGPIVVEKQLKVSIKKAEMSDLISMLDKIEKAKEPVFIKRIDIRKKTKAPGAVKATLLISTYVKKDAEG